MDDGWHEYEPPTLCAISMGLGISIMVERGASAGAAPPPPEPGNLLWGDPDGLFWDVDRLIWGA
jgi:hypothetical protein